ncbi:MAG: two-component system, NarL family, sensor histidine kinase DegS [Peptostreptococcaceae bacterium]|nr:two-component system, NarL family, sensor histidine kinase DegS [Peptostreptococcaceae bacterium]
MNESGFSPKSLDKVINDVILSIQSGQEEIFNISENVLKECELILQEIEKFKAKVLVVIKEAEKLTKEEKESRQKLFLVSKNIGEYSESDIRKAYNEAKDKQVQLLLKREEEQNLIRERNQLEIRLKKNYEIVEQAESLMSKMKSVMDFLVSDLVDLGKTISNLEDKTQIGMKIIKAQEEERRRIARDIHDGPAQNIASLVIKTEIVEKLLKRGNIHIEDELKDIKTQLRAVLKEIRGIMYDLRPISLDEVGLIPTIERMAADMSYEKNIAIEIKKISDYPIFNSLNKLIVYRIVQESLNNIIKHSGAKNVVIRMDVRQDSINGSVSDDGKGFDTDSFMEAKDKSFGLSSMKERAEIAHGSITIKSVVGKGTKIMFSIPNEEEPNE